MPNKQIPCRQARPAGPKDCGKRARRALLGAAVCLAVFFLVWLVAVRPQSGKSLSQKLCDDYTATTDPITGSISQSFAFDDDLYALAFVFELPGEQPAGALELTLTDAATGEVLARSQGDMANILPGQYTGLGLDRKVEGAAGRRYTVTLTPAYTGGGRLALGCSAGAVLIGESLSVNGQPLDATAALLVTYRQIGGFLSRFYWLFALGITAAAALGIWLALGHSPALHRVAFVLVVVFGVLYTAVLPPYAAPDEQYHINQSFTLACRWANAFSGEDWSMGHVPLESSYRREHDTDPLLQNEKTTVFTWQETAENLFTASPDTFDSHTLYQEAQADANPTLYLPSAAAVFLCYLLHIGFVPTLLLGRLVNLLLFAGLAALAIRRAPFGKRIFFAAALLPMTLHLAASFSRDSLLLGLCFAFTAQCMDAAWGERPPTRRRLAALGVTGLLLAPAKLVYLPLAFLVLLIPAARCGQKPKLFKAGFLAACLALTVFANGAVLAHALGAFAVPAAQAQAGQAAQAETDADQTALSGPAAVQAIRLAAGPAAIAAEPSAEPTVDPAAAPAELSAQTAEAFVRRLYYYGENRLDEPQSEVDYWVSALQNGDVTAALLGQSFFFGPDASYTDAELVTRLTLTFWGRDALANGGGADLLEKAANGQREMVYKTVYAAAETQELLTPLGITVGSDDTARFPLDRTLLLTQTQAAQAEKAAARQSVATGADAICFTPGYILHHLPQTAALLVRSLLKNGDHYLRGVVGGSLSYYTLELAWGWVLLLYLLLAYAVIPAEGDSPAALPGLRRARVFGAGAALLCCALAVFGCLTWTPTYYETLYGLQGRYFLPVLPLGLLALAPRSVRVQGSGTAPLVIGLTLANAGVLLNAFLAVLAR